MNSYLRSLPLLATGLVVAAVTAGCSNGLQTTSPGADPSVSAPSSAAPTSASPSAPTSSSPSPSASASATDQPTTRPSSTASTTATTSASDRCTLSHLSVGVREADGGGAAGSNYVLLTFRNTGAGRCTLYGYPGVSFVGKGNGTQLGVPAVRSGGASAEAVRLASGSTTTALLKIVNAGNYDATTCAPTTADGFRVYPPGSTTAAYVKFSAQACQRDPGSTKQLQVSPVGTSG